MMDPSERAIPGVSAHFLMMEAMSRYSFAKKRIKKNDQVLDVACGTGYGTSVVSQVARNAYGIDISEEAIKFAQDNYQNSKTNFLVADVYDLPFKDNYFDWVVAYEMIEHLKTPEIFLKEMKRVITNGGNLILSTPNKIVTSPDGDLMSPYHTKEYDVKELTRLLSKYFNHVEVFGQRSSEKAEKANHDFMNSQKARQTFVDVDFLSIRKLIPKPLKEKIWTKFGSLFGRETQETLTESDFQISKTDPSSAQYLVAICRK